MNYSISRNASGKVIFSLPFFSWGSLRWKALIIRERECVEHKLRLSCHNWNLTHFSLYESHVPSREAARGRVASLTLFCVDLIPKWWQLLFISIACYWGKEKKEKKKPTLTSSYFKPSMYFQKWFHCLFSEFSFAYFHRKVWNVAFLRFLNKLPFVDRSWSKHRNYLEKDD